MLNFGVTIGFARLLTSLQDDSHYKAYIAITPDVIARIDGFIQENRRITEKAIPVHVGISHG